jgi:hypothetical protein
MPHWRLTVRGFRRVNFPDLIDWAGQIYLVVPSNYQYNPTEFYPLVSHKAPVFNKNAGHAYELHAQITNAVASVTT